MEWESIHFWQYWPDWAILAAILAVLAYTVMVIREERFSFRDSAIPINFHRFRFLIPSWWRAKRESSHQYSFERRDKHHDWKASLYWFDDSRNSLDLAERGRTFMRQKGIQFDRDCTLIKNPVAMFEGRPTSPNRQVEMVRIEGTATKTGGERKYIDLFVAKMRQREGHLLAISECGVLNGPLEGPYFEEVMFQFTCRPQ